MQTTMMTRSAQPDGLLTRRAQINANSVDLEARTASIVFSTGAPVRRRDFEGEFIEVLDLAPSAVDLSRIQGGPLLNNHRSYGLENVIGVVLSARTDGKTGTADIKLSARPEVAALLRDMADGVIRNVSVGYTAEDWENATDPETGLRSRRAKKWTVHEISLVAMAADPGAQVRSTEMPNEEVQTEEAGSQATTTATTSQTTDANRAAVDTEIRNIATVAGLGEDFAAGLITRGADANEARRAAFEELARRGGSEVRNPATPSIVVGADWSDIATRARRIGEALYTRVNPAHRPSDASREFVGLTMPEIARLILRERSISTTGLSPSTVIARALHTTSDFSLILGDTVNRTLRAAYQAAPAGVRMLARQTTARDFRAKHRLQLGEAPTLEKVNEKGEFKRGSMAEADETYSLATFGRVFGITRQAIVNDDLGAFADLSGRLGLAAAEFEAQHLVDLLTTASGAGPTMSDTKALFHADHGNLAEGTGGGGAPDETTLSAAREAMRLQTGLSGKPINVTPRHLLVPAALETSAEKIVAQLQPTKSSDVNVFSGRLDPVVDARLDAKSQIAWYLVADPAMADGLEYAYLEGEPGPQIETRNGFDVDGVEVKVRLDYGAGFVDHRSWFRNAGE